MPRISPFEKYAEQYESWFEKNRWVYEAELRAVKAMLPAVGTGLEIVVGTGRFAGPLGIKDGDHDLLCRRYGQGTDGGLPGTLQNGCSHYRFCGSR